MQHFDVAIIGGGPAGMNAALVLARARKCVVLIDERLPRNRVTHQSHGVLSRDGISPKELRRIAMEQIKKYPSVQIIEDIAVSVTGTDGNFQITTIQAKNYRSKKLLFAVGMKDLPLDIDGLSDAYGTSAFICPYCDGWELQDHPLVLIAHGEKAMHLAKSLAGWTDQYTICTNGPDEWTDEQRKDIKLHNIQVFNEAIQRIESIEGMVQGVVLENGTVIPCTGIFFAPKLTTGSNLPRALGCLTTDAGIVIVDEFGKTNVPGIYSAGDVASEVHLVITAASLGALAGVSINGELLSEVWNSKIPKLSIRN